MFASWSVQEAAPGRKLPCENNVHSQGRWLWLREGDVVCQGSWGCVCGAAFHLDLGYQSGSGCIQGVLGVVIPDHGGVLVSFPTLNLRSFQPFVSLYFCKLTWEKENILFHNILNEHLYKVAQLLLLSEQHNCLLIVLCLLTEDNIAE